MSNPIIDPQSIPKAEPFDGKDENWAHWSFTFKSFAWLLGLLENLEACEHLAVAPART